MVFDKEDKARLKPSYKIVSRKRLGTCEIQQRDSWKNRGLDKLLKKLRETGTTDRKKGELMREVLGVFHLPAGQRSRDTEPATLLNSWSRKPHDNNSNNNNVLLDYEHKDISASCV